jgi:hypothetical protein
VDKCIPTETFCQKYCGVHDGISLETVWLLQSVDGKPNFIYTHMYFADSNFALSWILTYH